jgi:hypothetical protein
MSFGLLYWVIMIIWFLFGLWGAYPFGGGNNKTLGGHVILFVLLVLLGWKVFGPALHQ